MTLAAITDQTSCLSEFTLVTGQLETTKWNSASQR
ncbi:MAG: hypothetical protein M2R45_03461 [Verrucomicrobia subdivision 3 bacterium]|nr:hypothetical protein [Limisphaerales bacterium]MCS1415722.1 hypothetical protein [Limisphaerales bacterium]